MNIGNFRSMTKLSAIVMLVHFSLIATCIVLPGCSKDSRDKDKNLEQKQMVAQERGESTEGARELFRKASELNIGNAFCTPEMLKQKAYFYKQAVQKAQGYAEAWNNLGDVYENLGDYQKAIDAYRKAVEVRPDLALPYFGLGDVYLKQGFYIEAKDWYEKGLAKESDPKNMELTKQRLEYIEETIKGIKENGVVRLSQIISMLKPNVFRGPSGIVNSPTITFRESQIGFATDSADLLPQAKEQLNELGIAFKHNELINESFMITGHADERQTKKYKDNYELSLRRAESIRDYLVKNQGISSERLHINGWGSSRPIAFGHDEASWSINRRVEVRKLDKVDEEVIKSENPKPGNPVTETSGTGNLNITYGLLFQKGPENWRVVKDGDTAYSGELYQIYLLPESGVYIYMYQKDKNGGSWLFPNSNIGIQNPLEGGRDYWIPRRDRSFKLDDTVGEETIFIVASREQAHDLEHLIGNPSASEEAVHSIMTRGSAGTRPGYHAVSGQKMEEIFGKAEFYKSISFTHR